MKSKEYPGKFDKFIGLDQIDKVIDIDQSPIGRTPRSNPATYTGLFTPIRDLFAKLPDSKVRGYQPGRFSFNVPGGRCESCSGDGVIKIEMHFLPDVYITCDVCKGRRYNHETLEVRYKGKNIYEVLDMTVEEALEFFASIPAIQGKLDTLNRVGPRATSSSASRPRPCRAARPSGSSSRPSFRSARPGAPSTFSTSRPRASISPTSSGSSTCSSPWWTRGTR